MQQRTGTAIYRDPYLSSLLLVLIHLSDANLNQHYSYTVPTNVCNGLSNGFKTA